MNADNRELVDVMTPCFDYDNQPYSGTVQAWDIDPAALARATAGPVRHVVLPGGGHPDGTILLPPGASVRLFLYDDDSMWDPSDEECYDPEDIAAWRRDAWGFAGLSAVVTLANGDEGESAVWGIEVGSYWPGSTEDQVSHVVPDIISSAASEAIATTRDVSAAVSEVLF